MPFTATEILNTGEAKIQLSIEEDRTDLDARIEQAIKSAVAHVQDRFGYPLLDVSTDYTLWPTSVYPDGALVIPEVHVKAITNVTYWEATQKRREVPSGTIDVADLGRMEERNSYTLLYPPADGWPVRLTSTGFRVVLTLGVDTVPEKWKTEVILWMREFFEQSDMIHKFTGLRRLGDGPIL